MILCLLHLCIFSIPYTYKDFSDEDGNILWEKLVQFNSQDLTQEWLTTKEAAEHLGSSKAKVTKLIKDGKLKAMFFSNRWLVHRSLSPDSESVSEKSR